MPSIRAEFETSLPDWQRHLNEDEWYFTRLNERIISRLDPTEAFVGLAEVAELVLEQSDEFLVGETMQLLLGLARHANTTERPKVLADS